MKKLFYSLFALAMTAMTFTGCEDVPAPYDDPNNSSDNSDKIEGAIPYTSLNLYTGWTLHKISADEPWSQGNSYTQATGYQKWEGADQKSNRAVEGYLISPKFNTLGSEHVKISFDHTIRYTNNVSGWADFHKIFVSTNYDGNNFDNAIWQEVNFKPVASPYSDWTLYTSGEIQLPEEVADKENVYVAFWFKAPENASTTWELQNFKIEAGIAEESPENPAAKEITCAEAIELTNALDDNATSAEAYVVTGYITQVVGNVSSGQQSFWMADTKDGGKMFEAYYANLPEGVSEFKNGSKVKITGNLTKYVKDGKVTAEMKNPTVEILEAGESGGESGEIKTVTIAEFNAASESTSVWYKISGTVKNLKDGDLYGNFDLEDNTGSVYVYGLLSEKGGEKKQFQTLASEKGIKNGVKITIIGNRGSYNDKIEVTNAYFVSVDGEGGGSGESGEIKTVTIVEFNAATESTTDWYKLSGTVKNLKDGDQYGNFDLEDNTGSVYVYGLLSEKGGEKKQFQTLAAAKGIKNGVKITIIGNRGSYNGKIEVMNAYFVSVDGEGGGGGDTPQGTGTYDSPLTVTQAIALGSADAAWVKGYIVGYVSGQVISSGAVFSAEGAVDTNILIAASASEKDVKNCMPIQLSREEPNNYRNAFGLKNNPDLLGKEVIMAGQLTPYFGVPGLKYPTYMEVNGKTLGNKVKYRKRR